MWYMNDYFMDSSSVTQFLDDVLSVFMTTLTIALEVPVFAFFFAFLLLAIASCLLLSLMSVTKPGAGK